MLNYLKVLIQSKVGNQKGQGMVEYAVIVAVVVAIGVTLMSDTGFKKSVTDLYSSLITTVSGKLPK